MHPFPKWIWFYGKIICYGRYSFDVVTNRVLQDEEKWFAHDFQITEESIWWAIVNQGTSGTYICIVQDVYEELQTKVD